jgi:hypothetical protein
MQYGGGMHLEVLTDKQKKVLSRLSGVLKNTDFYLAGGTALALQTGHRMSQDFDWFIPHLGEIESFLGLLRAAGVECVVTSTDRETCYLLVDTVQVSFLGYDYPLLQTKVPCAEYDIYLAGTDDIAAMKLAAVASRGSRKDFVDLYFLFKNQRPLKDCLCLYQEKFKIRDIGHVIRSLVYFDNADAEPEVQMITPLSWVELKAAMERWVKEISL